MKRARFFNRELSWLEFNARVLDEALDQGTPLLERLRFLSIVSSNFDEFFMVRVAALKSRIKAGDEDPDPSGMGPAETLREVSRRAKELVARQYACFLEDVLPAMEREGVVLARPSAWTPAERRRLESFFAERVAPLLTPLRVEEEAGPEGGSAPGATAAGATPAFGGPLAGRPHRRSEDRRGPLPAAGNLRIHAAFILEPDRSPVEAAPAPGAAPEAAPAGGLLAIVQVPPNLERFVRVPDEGAVLRFALLDDLVAAFGGRLFPGYAVRERLLIKVTRDADIGVDEDRDEDFIAALEEVLAGRHASWPVRLATTSDSPALAERLRLILGLEEEDLYVLPGPIDLRTFMELPNHEALLRRPGIDRLRFPTWAPVPAIAPSEGASVLDEIEKGDRLLHVPYESFDPVAAFVDAAADDPTVLAVKMTLYRTSGDSPIVRALARAAGKGKQVTVLVELKARFDEERNLAWASRLEQAGAIVVYGLARLKVHSKAALVVRRAPDGGIRRYLHLSTGNYNDRTARLYADLSLFTADEELCREASIFFNMITGYSAVQELRHLAVAPFDLKTRLLSLIRREAERSSPESPGLIVAKMNALIDPDMIEALYEAGRAGVRVRLNVRGICALVPGARGLSENVEVVSVLGRYLEHARAFRFRNGGAEEYYLSSADWMPRNLEKRVELLFPVYDPSCRARLAEILDAYFEDNVGAHRLLPSGAWKRVKAAEGEPRFSSQAFFRETTKRRRALEEEPPERELPVRRRPS